MFKTLSIAAIVGIIGLAQPVSANVVDEAAAAGGFHLNMTSNGSYSTHAGAELTSALPTSTGYELHAAQAEIAGLTNVTDAVALTPFWGPVDFLIIAMAAVAAVFMRLLLMRQRGPRYSTGIFVETIR